jgi:flagellin-like protein
MKLKALFADEEAVSPVIGVILMVAITVILAAVIGTFVLGVGDTAESRSPTADLDVEYEASEGNITITHSSGESIDQPRLTVRTDSTAFCAAGDYASDNVSTGCQSTTESETLDTPGGWANGDEMKSGDSVVISADAGANGFDSATVRVVWEDEAGENSNTLRKWEGPSA